MSASFHISAPPSRCTTYLSLYWGRSFFLPPSTPPTQVTLPLPRTHSQALTPPPKSPAPSPIASSSTTESPMCHAIAQAEGNTTPWGLIARYSCPPPPQSRFLQPLCILLDQAAVPFIPVGPHGLQAQHGPAVKSKILPIAPPQSKLANILFVQGLRQHLAIEAAAAASKGPATADIGESGVGAGGILALSVHPGAACRQPDSHRNTDAGRTLAVGGSGGDPDSRGCN